MNVFWFFFTKSSHSSFKISKNTFNITTQYYEFTYEFISLDKDSRAVIQALRMLTMSSKLVKECITSLAVVSSYLYRLSLVWVPGDSGQPMSLQERTHLPKSRQDGNEQVFPSLHAFARWIYEPCVSSASVGQQPLVRLRKPSVSEWNIKVSLNQ